MPETSRSWLPAAWDAPAHVRAGTSTRIGGCSQAPYDTLNLAGHVGDYPEHVIRNRATLERLLELPSAPLWLNQVHGDRVITAGAEAGAGADGCYTDRAGIICAVLTADCVPLLLCDVSGNRVAAVHVGWRGFCAGVIGSALRQFQPDLAGLLAWIGPHIGPESYEVGAEVREACLARNAGHSGAFTRNQRGRWQASLEALVRRELLGHGIDRVTAAGLCTCSLPREFYSYRRDGRTGRMASMIWIAR